MPATGSGELLPGWRRVVETTNGKRRTWYVDALDMRYSPAEYRHIAQEQSATDSLPEAPPVEPRPLESAKAASDPRATSEQISQSLVYVLLIVTAVMGFALRDDALVLTAEEAAEMALPAGNILSGSLLNKRYGKYLRDSGDYTALAYSLVRYGLRVAEDVRHQADQRRSISVTVNQTPEGTPHAAPLAQQTPANPAGSPAPGHPGGPVAAPPGLPYQGAAPGRYSPIPRVSPPSAANGAGGRHSVPTGDAGKIDG